MKYILTILFTVFTCGILSAQNSANIVVESPDGTTKTAYTSFEEAVGGAEAGATVYLPAAAIPVPNSYHITKQLHFRGAGINSMKLAGGQTTKICSSDYLYITETASGSTFEGIEFNVSNNVQFIFKDKANAGKGFQLSFTACKFNREIHCRGGWNDNKQYNCVFYFEGSVIEALRGDSYIESEIIANNCVFTSDSYYYHATFMATNSIFTYWYKYGSYNMNNDTNLLSNCILRGCIRECNFSTTLQNSIVCDKTNSSADGDAAYVNCQDQAWGDIFVNGKTEFSFGADYHLKEGSLAIGNGTNGTDMGLYGGVAPFTDGMVPNVPVVYEKAVSARTNASGKLEGSYKVKVINQ